MKWNNYKRQLKIFSLSSTTSQTWIITFVMMMQFHTFSTFTHSSSFSCFAESNAVYPFCNDDKEKEGQEVSYLRSASHHLIVIWRSFSPYFLSYHRLPIPIVSQLIWNGHTMMHIWEEYHHPIYRRRRRRRRIGE